MAMEQLQKELAKPKKKSQSRMKNNTAKVANSQPIPQTIRTWDYKPASGSTRWRPYHLVGKTILPPETLAGLMGEMKILHDKILHTE
jgi:hypothetical protein